jgi:hypothetical protein
MPRFYKYECTCGHKMTKYTYPVEIPEELKTIRGGYKFDANNPFDPYPPKTVDCEECGKPVVGNDEDKDSVTKSPVYFNYLEG